MEEDFEAVQGTDLLGLALGREPGASDLDEFVHFEVYFDGCAKAAEAGEAVPYLRARICEAFDILSADLGRYLWHRDRFILEIELGDSIHDEPHLVGHLRTGDGAEDEWFAVHLLRTLTSARRDVSCRIEDSDGEILLIEAALAAPRWLTPESAENRCWLRGGQVHLLPKPRPPEPVRLPRRDALVRLRAGSAATAAKEKVQNAIMARLEGYPRSAVDLARHTARAVLPVPVARLLLAYPQLVSTAVDHLPLPTLRELQKWRRELQGEEANVYFDCEGLPTEETACVGIRFTRLHYARLAGLRCQLPQRFARKHWKQPAKGAVEEKAMHLGATLCAGLEAAFLQGTQSATAALRWPSSAVDPDAVLPPLLPWAPDAAFAKHAKALRNPVVATSPTARRAFVQQSALDEPFRQELMRALRDERLAAAVDLAVHWKDSDDAEDWLQVSEEELDREMQARQAEFEAYDQRRSSAKSAGGDKKAPNNAEDLAKEFAAMGQKIAGMLERSSCVEGVETGAQPAAKGLGVLAEALKSATNASKGDDSDSESSDGSELDVLGMEEVGAEAGSGSEEDEEEEEARGDREGMYTYMSELDEQLADVLDGEDMRGVTEAPPPTAGGLPLTSHHVKVHGGGLELDVHAMEHVLASYCSENGLEPGPASLLLKELGLAGVVAAGGRGRAESGGNLNSMD